MKVQLDTGTPIFSAVLVPQIFQETEVHQSFFRTHFRLKGAEAARTCLTTVASLNELEGLC